MDCQICPIRPWNIDLIDPSYQPQNDFYMYSTGGWQNKATLPTGYSRWGSFDELNELNRYRIRDIVDGLPDMPDKVLEIDPHSEISLMHKIKTYHKAASDVKAREAAGIEPLRPLLERCTAEQVRTN